MATKDIMSELHGLVRGKYKSPQKYFHGVTKPFMKAQLSEISAFRLVAEHCIENDIKPANVVSEMLFLLEELPRNLFILKTSERLHFLRNSANDLKWTEHDEKNFFCTGCGYVFPNSKRYGASKQCKPCVNNSHKKSYHKNKNKDDKKPVDDVPEQNEPLEIEQSVEAVPHQVAIEPQVSIEPEIEPFVSFTDVMTDPGKGRVTVLLETEMFDLKSLLEIIDPYLLKVPKCSDSVGVNDDKQSDTEKSG